jgi:tetratricopeptide (TPR) repeat protein
LDGHASEALDILAHVAKMVPEYADVYVHMIACQLVLNQPKQAAGLIDTMRRYSSPERAQLRRAFTQFREGDCVGYYRALKEIQASTDARASLDAALHASALFLEAGHAERASAHAEAALAKGSSRETEPEQASLRAVLAWAQLQSGKTELAVENARKAIELETGPVIVGIAGSAFARARRDGLAVSASRLCEEFSDLPLYQIARHRINGELARAKGRSDAAISEFRKASALEPRLAHRQYLLESLADGEERTALCRNAVAFPWQALRPPPLHNLGSLTVAVPVILATPAKDPWAEAFYRSSRALPAEA